MIRSQSRLSPAHDSTSRPKGHHDTHHFPKGQCRYILTTPGLVGERCACLGFRHNSYLPGSACDCGHMSCFHTNHSKEEQEVSARELELLKLKMKELEDWTVGSEHGGFRSLMNRVSHLEEKFQSARVETEAEIKGSYQSVNGAWEMLSQLQRRMALLEGISRCQSEQLQRASKELLDLRNRQLELLDSDESLEERIEKLEAGEATAPSSRVISRRGSFLAMSMPLGNLPNSTSSPGMANRRRRRSSATRSNVQSGRILKMADVADVTDTDGHVSSSMPSGPWTIHVSLMLSKEQQKPFEKDSVAYKRCLSRGLQRMVVVASPEAMSVSEAISASFKDILHGRPWEPLQCLNWDVAISHDLPTIRPLDETLVGKDYTAEFLKKNCAVCDSNGRMESLYIVLRDEALSWDSIRQQDVYLDGLESAWDGECEDIRSHLGGGEKPEATVSADVRIEDQTKKGENTNKIVATETSNKRRASIGVNETESFRSKMLRTSCQLDRIELHRGVWTSL